MSSDPLEMEGCKEDSKVEGVEVEGGRKETRWKMLVCVVCVLVAQSCPTLCDPMDCNPPGFSVHEIFQARILE